VFDLAGAVEARGGPRRPPELIRAVLDYCGALTTSVTTTEGAMRVMRQIRADVIVVDTDAEEARALLAMIRALEPEAGGTVPIVALGADSSRGERAARLSGYDGVIFKPLSPWHLCRMLSSLIRS
jgi:CheY-like chemotaxis protein